jgi:hypothetical protein
MSLRSSDLNDRTLSSAERRAAGHSATFILTTGLYSPSRNLHGWSLDDRDAMVEALGAVTAIGSTIQEPARIGMEAGSIRIKSKTCR